MLQGSSRSSAAVFTVRSRDSVTTIAAPLATGPPARAAVKKMGTERLLRAPSSRPCRVRVASGQRLVPELLTLPVYREVVEFRDEANSTKDFKLLGPVIQEFCLFNGRRYRPESAFPVVAHYLFLLLSVSGMTC